MRKVLKLLGLALNSDLEREKSEAEMLRFYVTSVDPYMKGEYLFGKPVRPIIIGNNRNSDEMG